MRLPSALLVSLSLSLPLCLPRPAAAGLHIVAQGVEVDHDAGVAQFTVRFDAEPDFWTLDEFGRVADSFQYEIDENWNVPPGLTPEGIDAVVRGDEIRVADALRIRHAGPTTIPDPDPAAGGWGPVRDEVPYWLDGGELRFNARLSSLGDTDGYFAYRLFTTEYGLTIDSLESWVLPPGEEPPPGEVPPPVEEPPGEEPPGSEGPPGGEPPPPSPIPLPPGVAGALITLALLGAMSAARRYSAAGFRATLAFARRPSGSNVRPK